MRLAIASSKQSIASFKASLMVSLCVIASGKSISSECQAENQTAIGALIEGCAI